MENRFYDGAGTNKGSLKISSRITRIAANEKDPQDNPVGLYFYVGDTGFEPVTPTLSR